MNIADKVKMDFENAINTAIQDWKRDAIEPDGLFSRNRKLDRATMIKVLCLMGGNSLRKELYDYPGLNVSASSFSERRAVIHPDLLYFILLNQTKLSISEIQQVWKAIKDLTKLRPSISCSPLEIARQAGWDDLVNDIENRVKTAISALESAGYVKRGRNMPHVYATSILAKDMREASFRIDQSAELIRNGEVEQGRITKSVLVIAEAQDMDANEFELVRALMQNNDDMRLIAVGDDDQNIYEFRGSDSRYLRSLIEDYGAVKYEMAENYRSKTAIVLLTNEFVSSIRNRMKSTVIEAVQNDEGTVSITLHCSKHMETAVVNQILETRGNGKCCVLTNTNDEALQILGLLLKNGVRAKLIQSLEGFRLYNLLELRFFLKQIDRSLKSPVISNDLLNRAKKQLFEVYSGSPCLEICKNLLCDFEAINPTKYLTDLEEFIRESNYEDFYDDEREVIYVSTIHKAKGCEFDAVYLMLSGNTAMSDEEKRKLYVGMTRAKDSLYIHCNTNLFSAFNLSGIVHTEDNNEYGEPEEISLQLTHKDVVLDFFKDKKEVVFQLKSGTPLFLADAYLSAELNGRSVRIAKLSKACRERLQTLHERGYIPYSANIRFIVAWKGENDTEETAVVLPDIHLKKQ